MFIPGRPLHAETQRHVARMSVRNDDHIEDLDLLIRGLIKEELWDKLDLICVAGPNGADSLLDLKGSQDSVLIGAPAFVADAGFTTVGTSAVINTQFTALSDKDNGFSLSVYIQNTPAGASGYFIGELYGAGSPSFSRNALQDVGATTLTAYAQVTGGSSVTTAGGGFRQGSRINNSNIIANTDGTVTPFVKSSVAWESGYHGPILVGCLNNQGVAAAGAVNEYSHWSVGAGMSTIDSLAFRTLIHEYFTRRGTAV